MNQPPATGADRANRDASGPIVWITWESQRRNRELAAALDVRLNEWSDLGAIRNRFRKYLMGVSRTLRLIVAERPAVIICQNPSIILATLCVLVGSITRIVAVVDAHNAGIDPAEGRSALLASVAKWLQRHADLTIVSNEGLAARVRANGGRACVLPDRIPALHGGVGTQTERAKSILFVCTYAADEPYREVLEAARQLPQDIIVYVSGNYRKRGLDPATFAPNVRLTGFISEDEYVSLLASVSVVMDLTSREDCLVCGAYEAMALAKPMILSDTRVNREYFSAGVVYARHDPEALRAAMLEAIEQRESLARECESLKAVRGREWENSLLRLREEIRQISNR